MTRSSIRYSKIKINYRELQETCLMNERDLIPEEHGHTFIDNKASILAVAHCDYICRDNKPDFAVFDYKGERRILSETLDDRLGVYLITKLLPSIGVKIDILLTTDEETGGSTADKFVTEKKYNWIFSFDRRGTDIVAYLYDNKEFEDMVKEATGQKLSHGSFSDIVKLSNLGVRGLNFGTGYHGEHTEGCYALEREVYDGLYNFLAFYEMYRKQRIEYTPPPPVTYSRKWWNAKTRKTEDALPFGGEMWGDGWAGYGDDDYFYPRGRSVPPVTPALPKPKVSEVGDSFYSKCDYCKNWGQVFYIPVLEATICSDCMHTVDGVGKSDKVKQELIMSELVDGKCSLCELCGTPGTDLKLYTVMVPDNVPTKKGPNRYSPHILCSFDARWIEENLHSKKFLDALEFNYIANKKDAPLN